MKFPDHKCGLTLEHNPHTAYYETVAQWLSRPEREGEDDFYAWQSNEARQRAIDTNEVWTLQWYPDTPIGFIAIAAPTLDELLAFASSDEHTS